MTFDWQNGRQLASVSDDGLDISYTYDANGVRTSKTVNGVTTTYTIEGSNVVKETNGTDTLWYYYDALDTLTGFELNGTPYFYVKNMQGDIVAITNASGNIVVEYVYDSWGKLVSVTGSLADTVGVKNPYRYRGYYCDKETNLCYVLNRYYDYNVQRWVNEDNLISGIGGNIKGYNVFAFCMNNPINMYDPTGNLPKSLKEVVSNFFHTLKIMGRIAISPFKAINAKVGFGLGAGAEFETSLRNVPITVGAVAAITDYVTYEKGEFDARNSTLLSAGVTVAEVFDFAGSTGYEHSYFDDNCNCKILGSNYSEKSDCIANQPIPPNNAILGVSVSAYFIIGFEVSIGVDLNAWNDELISIFNENMEYVQNGE